MARIGSEQNLAQEFGGTFVPDDSRNDGSVFASYLGCEEALEDDELVFGRDPLRRFTPLDEVPADAPTPWCRGSWAKNARFPLGISSSPKSCLDSVSSEVRPENWRVTSGRGLNVAGN